METRISSLRLRMSLFNGVFSTDELQRSIACANISSFLRNLVSQIPKDELSPTKNVYTDEDGGQKRLKSTHASSMGGLAGEVLEEVDEVEENLLVLNTHLLVVLRMSLNCPFEDVRYRFKFLLNDLKMMGIKIPKPVNPSASFFIAKERLVPFETENQLTRKMMVQCFLSSGRFSNVYRLMAYFPGYLEKFLQTYNQILRYQGPLPKYWRNYIAIMASSMHNCQYLVSLQIREFLLNGGDAQWLHGLDHCPEKLRNLSHINHLMAHQPWLLKKEHFKVLGKGSESWSMSELVQAIVIMATFHSLSSFVLGCGVSPEIDMADGTCNEFESVPETDSDYDDGDDLELSKQTTELINRLLKKNSFDEDLPPSKEVFETLETSETFQTFNTKDDYVTGEPGCKETKMKDLLRFSGDLDVKHVDFNVKSSDYSVFRLQDYNWEEHGCSLIGKYLAEVGDFLDEEFSAILNLTDYSLFNTNESRTEIDTWPFRQAIWYYVLRLAGMSHDDYNYHQVNIYLNKKIKKYIKKVACTPESVVAADFHNMGFNFRPDEKVQINLLAAEARKCAELLYAIKCVSDESQ